MSGNNKRKETENFIIKMMKILDPSCKNSEYYKEKFSKMSNKEFDKMMNVYKREESYLRVYYTPYKNDIQIENSKKCLDAMGVPLFEKIALPYVTGDKNKTVWTKEKVPVGYIHIKMLEQMVHKKNTMSISTEKRDPMTGQVTSGDKNGRSSDMENISLITIEGTDNILKEYNSVRADNMIGKTKMLSEIKNNGSVSLKNLQVSKQNSISLNTLDTLFLACGIKTDLVTNGLLLKKTMAGRQQNSILSKGQIKGDE